MRSKVITMTMVLVALVAGATAAWAAPDWILLGKRNVSDAADHDTILVGTNRGQWSAIRIEVRRRAVEFHKVVVVFGNGGRQEVELRQVIEAGGSSRAIDLNGDDRTIQRVELRYDAQSAGRQAVVRVMGRR